jgi:lipopolysaccharide/colanic/teichoic acid biosynthesis glycosyltransferase
MIPGTKTTSTGPEAAEERSSCAGCAGAQDGKDMRVATERRGYDVVKRGLDIVAASAGLLVLSPLFLLVGLSIRAGSAGKVFYRGIRAGRFGVPFRIWKFRSMVENADRIGGPSTSDDDPRVTRIGSFMRRYKLDELPQLFNVLRGEMSLVGPRPEVLSEVEAYTPEQRRILEVRPGITDWASIWNSDEGAVLAGASDAHAVYKERIQPTKLALQLKYRQESSLATDLKILLFTLRKIVDREWMPEELRTYGRP